jgi:AcrR family transcriptional regulator
MTDARSPEEDAPLSRDDRRRRTEGAILEAARQQFAEEGFERVTIRGVAAQAGIDPALVMQYFGSKERLFAAAARWPKEHERIKQATPQGMPAAALADVFERFEHSDDREGVIALLRSCLTHPSATRIMRDEVMCDRTASVAAQLEGDDAELRAGLLGACMMGLSIARYVMEVEPVASASREDIARLFTPVLGALTDPPT